MVGHKKWRAPALNAPVPANHTVAYVMEEATQPTPEHELVAPPHHASRLTPPPSPATLPPSPAALPSSPITRPHISLPPRTSPPPTSSLEIPLQVTLLARATPPPSSEAAPISKPPQALAKKTKDDDSMDIVPDSEPPRTDLPFSERQPNPPRQLKLQPVKEVEQEIIPDSFEEEESLEPSAPPSPMSVEQPLERLVDSPEELVDSPEDLMESAEALEESVDSPEEDEAPVTAYMSGSRPVGRTSGRVRNRAVYTEDSDSESGSEPLAKIAEKLVTMIFYVCVQHGLTSFFFSAYETSVPFAEEETKTQCS